MKPWEQKCHRVIAELCLSSYVRSNRLPDGSFRKRHVPYSVPEIAERLVKCLADDDEETAKSIFVHELV